jgi:MSHA biogenesis protein MshN
MSLINQMLKDLEERGASNADVKTAIASNLTAANIPDSSQFITTSSKLSLIKMGGLMILLAGGAYLWTQNSQAQSRIAQAPQAEPHQKTIDLTLKPISHATTEIVADTSILAASQAPTNESPPLFETELRFNLAEIQTNSIQENNSQANSIQPSVEKAQKKEILANLETPKASKKKVVTEKLTPIELGSPEAAEKSPVLAHLEKPSTKPKTDSTLIGKQIGVEQKSANLYRLALTYLQQGRVAEAQASLALALEANPINHEARQTLAGLLLDNKRNDEARATLAAGVAIAPEQCDFRMALARLQVEAGDVKGALYSLEQGLAYAKNNGNYQAFLATLLQRANRHDEAIEHYNAALSLNSVSSNTSASTLVGLGISLQAVGKLTESQEIFTRAQSNATLSPELLSFVEQRIKQINQSLQN